jgi:hypothetical protein
VGGACRMHGRDENRIHFSQETLMEDITLETWA